jgi:D-3-phosphoglycerate dehydrogenase
MVGQGSGTRIWRGRFTKALVLEKPHASLDALLREEGIEVERLDAPPTTEDGLIEVLRRGGHQLIFKRSRVQITRRVVESCPSLHAVLLCCIGDDSVDKRACADAGVLVMNDPISNGRSVAEMVLGEMLCAGRRIFEAVDTTRRHEWHKTDKARYELKGKTLGVVGLGNIGKQVAQLGEALGMKVCFYDTRDVAREVGETLHWQPTESLKEVFERSHVITLHLSAQDTHGHSNEGLLTREVLMALGTKTDQAGPRLFLNAARGFVHSAEDLLAAVEGGAIDYAFVDVFPEEPHADGEPWVNPYAGTPRIFATPHIGAATQEAQPRIAQYVARTTRLFNRLGHVRDCVYSPRFPIGLQGAEQPKYILSVVHSDRRGTKKAIDEAIFEAGRSNLSSAHHDFAAMGIAYDVNALDGPMSDDELHALVERAVRISGDPSAIRSVRMIEHP